MCQSCVEQRCGSRDPWFVGCGDNECDQEEYRVPGGRFVDRGCYLDGHPSKCLQLCVLDLFKCQRRSRVLEKMRSGCDNDVGSGYSGGA